jgi:hypothetical protein
MMAWPTVEMVESSIFGIATTVVDGRRPALWSTPDASTVAIEQDDGSK